MRSCGDKTPFCLVFGGGEVLSQGCEPESGLAGDGAGVLLLESFGMTISPLLVVRVPVYFFGGLGCSFLLGCSELFLVDAGRFAK
jgi:hypothetical protein